MDMFLHQRMAQWLQTGLDLVGFLIAFLLQFLTPKNSRNFHHHGYPNCQETPCTDTLYCLICGDYVLKSIQDIKEQAELYVFICLCYCFI